MAEPACPDPPDPDYSATFPPIDVDFLDTLPSDADLAFPDGFLDDLSFTDDLDFSLDDLLHSDSPAPDSPSHSTVSLASDDCCPLDVPSPESGHSGGDSSGSVSDNRQRSNDPPSPDSASKSSSLISRDLPDSSLAEPVIKSEDGIRPAAIAKRKKEGEEGNPRTRVSKVRRAVGSPEKGDSVGPAAVFQSGKPEEGKRQARLMRNRESAQLSRQRKKHYVEELEEKVRSMHTTISELNGKLSYIIAENASLRQQLSGRGGVPMPSPGMYPVPPPPYVVPWIPGTPFVVKPQGSQVPLVPIPRIKPQQPTSAPKTKKSEAKKAEGGKTKKVASVSLLGLLFFLLLFGGLVPMVNVRYGSVTNLSRLDYGNGGFMGQSRGRVLAVRGPVNGSTDECRTDCSTRRIGVEPLEMDVKAKDRIRHSENASEPLLASLYVPRNDKLVKIDGNLIIHSVLASEKAMASAKGLSRKNSDKEKVQVKGGETTGLAILGNVGSALAVSSSEVDVQRHPRIYRNPAERLRALGSGSGDNYDDKRKSTTAEGPLQQWFREGLAGPMMSSGMCTEVFQFEVSSNPGAIVSANSVVNASDSHPRYPSASKMKNRRILHPPIPLPSSTFNKTKAPEKSTQEGKLHGNSSVSSSMVVSVLVDPREAVDADVESMVSPKPKSLSRIFVVVLLDSVKYVTYSCVLPIKGSGPHLVAK